MGREGDGRDVMGEENTLRYATLRSQWGLGYCKQRSNRHAVMSCPFLEIGRAHV